MNWNTFLSTLNLLIYVHYMDSYTRCTHKPKMFRARSKLYQIVKIKAKFVSSHIKGIAQVLLQNKTLYHIIISGRPFDHIYFHEICVISP